MEVHPLWHVLNPTARKREFPDEGWRTLVRIARNLALRLEELHRTGLVIGELSDANVLVNADARVHLAGEPTPIAMYLPPELQGDRGFGQTFTREHDLFALAILIYRILLMGRHPWYSTPIRPGPQRDWLSPGLDDAFTRAFAGAPRPTAADWARELEIFESRLVDCKSMALHQHLPNYRSCPWCKLDEQGAVYFARRQAAADTLSTSFSIETFERDFQALPLPEDPLRNDPIEAATPLPDSPPEWYAPRLFLERSLLVSVPIVPLVTHGETLLLASLIVPLSWLVATPAFWLARARRKTRIALENARLSWYDAERVWNRTGIREIFALEDKIKADIEAYKVLSEREESAMRRLRESSRKALAAHYLSQYLIHESGLELSPDAVRDLEALGIDSAADLGGLDDVNAPHLSALHLRLLHTWKSGLELRFQQNPQSVLPPSAIQEIRSNFDREREELESSMFAGMQKIVGDLERWKLEAAEPRADLEKARKEVLAARARLTMLKGLRAW